MSSRVVSHAGRVADGGNNPHAAMQQSEQDRAGQLPTRTRVVVRDAQAAQLPQARVGEEKHVLGAGGGKREHRVRKKVEKASGECPGARTRGKEEGTARHHPVVPY